MHVYMHVHVSVHVYTCLCPCMRMYLRMRVRICEYLRARASAFACACPSMAKWVDLCASAAVGWGRQGAGRANLFLHHTLHRLRLLYRLRLHLAVICFFTVNH